MGFRGAARGARINRYLEVAAHVLGFTDLAVGHGWDVKCVEWHPTKGLLVSGSKDNMMKFWDPRTGNCISTLQVFVSTRNLLLGAYLVSQAFPQEYNPSTSVVSERKYGR